MDLSARLDALAEKLQGLALPLIVRAAVEEAAKLVAKPRMTTRESRMMKRTGKKHAHKKKVWVEVTSQPKKGRHGNWVGHASFFWKGDHTKTKHSQVITPGGPAKLSIKSMKLFVKPKGAEGYFYGAKTEKPSESKGESEKEAPKKEPIRDENGSKTLLDPNTDDDGDGVADAARVGVPAKSLAPPPTIPRLKGLEKEQAAIEEHFDAVVEKDPDGIADDYLSTVLKKAGDKNPPTFVTDDVKFLHPDYHGGELVALKDKDGKPKFDNHGKPVMVPPQATMDWRAKNNVCLHNAANAVAKRAFVKHLDEIAKLSEGDPKKSVLVTSGGCGSGKGFCIKNGPGALKSLKEQSGAVWDAAGEQNGTENPWILQECKKRGIKPTFLFVDADPERQWASPDLGVVQRAADPEGEGRMVDAQLFADSYALGAKNFAAFHDKQKDNADFVFINTWDMAQGKDKEGNPLVGKDGKPKMFPVIKPADGLDDRSKGLDSNKLYDFATKTISEKAPSEAIKEGATVGQKIWGPPNKAEKASASAAWTTNMTINASKTGEALKKLRDTLLENMKQNMKALEDFERTQARETMESTKDKVMSKDTKGKLSRHKSDEGSDVDAAVRMDALVTVLDAKVRLPEEARLALEEAAVAVLARVRRRRHRMMRYAAQKQAGKKNIDKNRPSMDAVNVGERLKSLPPSVQRSKDRQEAKDKV